MSWTINTFNAFVNDVSRPDGDGVDDILLAAVICYSTDVAQPAITITPDDAGWTELTSVATSSGGSGRFGIWFRSARENPVLGTYSFTVNGDVHNALIARYTGVDTDNPISDYALSQSGSDSSVANIPSAVAVSDNSMLVTFATGGLTNAFYDAPPNAQEITLPGSMTFRAEGSGSPDGGGFFDPGLFNLILADEALPSAGATGVRTITFATSHNPTIGINIVLNGTIRPYLIDSNETSHGGGGGGG